MAFLNPGDRRDASLVSKKFLEVAFRASKIVVRFKRCFLDDNCEPVKRFLESPRPFTRFIIDKVKFGESLEKFGLHLGPMATELKITYSPDRPFECRVFEWIFNHMSALKTLEINSASDEFFLKSHCKSTNALQTVTKFSLTAGNINYQTFVKVLDLLPNLEVLHCDFNLCYDDEDFYAYDEMVEGVVQRYPHLKEFLLNNTFMYSPFFTKNLTNFHFGVHRLAFPLKGTNEECAVFLNAHKQLTHLGKHCCIRV